MSDGAHPDGIVGVSLKMYLGLEQTRQWLTAAAELMLRTRAADHVDVVFLPGFLSLALAGEVLAGTGAHYGAQDVFWEDSGPYTGEVSAPMLREAGCSYVEVGHAERRHLFGEDDDVTARKAAAGARAGLVPIVCVGELHAGSLDDAVRECRAQVEPVLRALPDDAEAVFAYEPVWAIGTSAPADPERVVEVAVRLRRIFEHRTGRTRLIYGGSAGPGLFSAVASGVDGLFLGRFAHDIQHLASVLAEVAPELTPASPQ